MTENTDFGAGPGTRGPGGDGHRPVGVDERLTVLEAQVQVLAEAVRALVSGLEETPVEEDADREERAIRGARLAHELLLSQGLQGLGPPGL